MDLRANAQFLGAATLPLNGQSRYASPDGHWVPRLPKTTTLTLKNQDAFRFDRIEDANHALVDVNWPTPDGITIDLTKHTGPFYIYQLPNRGRGETPVRR